jgi:hypothetical protein
MSLFTRYGCFSVVSARTGDGRHGKRPQTVWSLGSHSGPMQSFTIREGMVGLQFF